MTLQEVRTLMELNCAMYSASPMKLSEKDAALQIAVWAKHLQNLPAEAVFKAMFMAFAKCRYPVKLSDLMEQLREMQGSQQPTAADSWNALRKAATEYVKDTWLYHFTALADDGSGRTQGQAARQRNRDRFNALPDTAKKWLGNPQTLYELGNMNEDSLHFRRRDYENYYKQQQDCQPLDAALLSQAAAALPWQSGLALDVNANLSEL